MFMKNKSASISQNKHKDNSKLVAILSYFIVGIFWYFIDEKVRKSPLTKFHVKQAINIFLLSIAVQAVISLIFFLEKILSSIAGAAFIILWIFGLVYSMNGQTKELPVVGQLAEKYLTF